MDPIIIPILGISVGIIVPIAIFILLYFEAKDKNKTILEISKNMDDPAKIEDLLRMLDERKKEPIDYRRGGLITLFVGLGIYLLGEIAIGRFFEGIGFLVGAIGVGTMLAGYMYPNTSEEITNAVDEYEKR
jgi:amino acid permease